MAIHELNAEGAAEAEGSVRKQGRRSETYIVDVSKAAEVRRAIEEDMLGYYCEAMKGCGVSGYSLAQVRADYDVAVLFMMNFNMIIAGAFVPSSERAREMAVEGLRRAVEAVLDRDLLRYIPD